ncbi:MAG: hypothetical protein ACTHLE_23430 [Agriterribacter sp.]
MKKILLAGIITVLSTTAFTAMAQTTAALKTNKKEIKKEERAIRRSEVSYQTKQQFAADFRGATNIAYSRNNEIDEVWFTQNGVNYKAFYDADAKLIGTTTTKDFSDLPAVAQKEIKKRYSEYKIDKVILFDDIETNDSDMMLYGQQFADADNYFVELSKDNKKIVLQVNMSGEVFYFANK